MNSLTGKTALVTGGSRGIGRAVALRLAAEGALVAVHYGGNDDAAKQTVARIEQAGGRAFAVQARFGDDGAVDRLFEGLAEGLAGGGLDILVNNAGIASANPIAQVTPEEFGRLLTINVSTPFFVVQRALPLLNDGGRIINMGSTASRFAVSTQIGYTISKAALESMGPSLANELGGRGITVNTVAPGAVRHRHDRGLLLHPRGGRRDRSDHRAQAARRARGRRGRRRLPGGPAGPTGERPDHRRLGRDLPRPDRHGVTALPGGLWPVDDAVDGERPLLDR